MRLMHAYWQSGPAKDDDRVLARLVGLSPDEWGGIRPDVEPFFDILHGQWLHWRLDEELEAAYDAINRNAARTKAATAARKAKRNDERDVVRNEHPIGSIHTPHAAAAGTPQARAKAKQVSGDFEGDVRAAERDLGIGGEV